LILIFFTLAVSVLGAENQTSNCDINEALKYAHRFVTVFINATILVLGIYVLLLTVITLLPRAANGSFGA